MSLAKYLQAIKGVDPGKIEVENVRSILDVSRFNARFICELGVTEGVFERRYGFVCPNEGRLIADFGEYDEIPEILTCHVCESDDQEQYVFDTASLKQIQFYRLTKRDDV